jgi:hypothetical protein
LMSMNPGGDYLQALNKDASQQLAYAAIAADFAPTSRNPRQLAMDLVADRLFGSANDLVVPRDGAWQVDDNALVAADRRLSIADEQAVSHNSYFASPAVQRRLQEWLPGAGR